jgi:nucleotide-binding universal stress UspA family protein
VVTARTRGTIVVGVDGSPSSVQALRWAARQAQLTGGEVPAVTVWHMPTTYGWILPVAEIDWAGNARTTLGDALKKALDDTPTEHLRRHVVEGHPVGALPAAEESARSQPASD